MSRFYVVIGGSTDETPIGYCKSVYDSLKEAIVYASGLHRAEDYFIWDDVLNCSVCERDDTEIITDSQEIHRQMRDTF